MSLSLPFIISTSESDSEPSPSRCTSKPAALPSPKASLNAPAISLSSFSFSMYHSDALHFGRLAIKLDILLFLSITASGKSFIPSCLNGFPGTKPPSGK